MGEAEEEFEDHNGPDDGPRYVDARKLNGSEIPAALSSLALFDDPYLEMQGYNLGIVDGFLNNVERHVLNRLIDEERTPMDDAMFLNAQSQMWIFAAYEVMRTWRQRAKEVIKWHANGGLEMKLKSFEEGNAFRDLGAMRRADMLRDVIGNPNIVDGLKHDLKRTHVMFTRMQYLRVSLAKHEVSGRPKSIPMAPGYGRINMWCGSLDYELSNSKYILGYMSRRDIADDIRAIPSLPMPSDENLESFDAHMKGPPD